MANNINILDASRTTKTLKTTEADNVHAPHHRIDGDVSVVLSSTSGATVPPNEAQLPAALTATGNLKTAVIEGRTLSIYRDLDLDEDGVNIKASAGAVYGIHLSNLGIPDVSPDEVRYVKLYNKATAPTVGSDTPVLTYRVKAGEDRDIPIPADGIPFATGIGIGCTTGLADADTGAPGANEMTVAILYG